MGGLFGKKSQSSTPTRLQAIQVNQSAYGNVVPLLYGTDRVPVTLIDYQDFKSTAETAKQGKGGGSPTTTGYKYSASWIGMLCEGPVNGVLQIYSDQTLTTLATAPGGPLVLFDGHSGQAAWSYMATNHPTHAIGYDRTACVAGANYSLGSSAAMPNLTFEVKGLKLYNGVGPDAAPSEILDDYCTDPTHGVGFSYLPTIDMNKPNGYRDYCVAMNFFFSPLESTQRSAAAFIGEMLQQTNSNCVWSAGIGLRIVPYGDQVVSTNTVTYTPDLTPIFSFQDADYCPPKGSPPVLVSIKPASQTYNVWNVEFLDRTNQYNTAIETYRDEQDIALNGVRIAPTVSLHAIKIRAIAATVAALLAQRNLYIRSTFTFTVRQDYSLLEPMDLVAINDSQAGIVNQLVRITETTDNPDDTFTIVAEEMLVGPAHAPVYNTQLAAGYAANYGATPGPVDVPYIFTIPPMLADPNSGGYEIGIAVGGTTGLWGGCTVYASLDNSTYQRVGTITHAARYGRLLGAIPVGNDPDTVSTLNVQLNSTAQQGLTSVSRADADQLRSLMLVDGEVMSYQVSTPLSTSSFKLSYLRRAAYNSSNTVHAVNTQFTILDDSVWRMPFDPGMVGQPVWFKFVSYNIFGGGVEDISTLPAYQAIFQGNNSGQVLQVGATPLVARGGCVQKGNQIYKQPNVADGWDSDCYSLDAFTGGCTVKFQPCQTNAYFMIGLNSDPLTDQSYTSLDHAWYINLDGNAYIYENGSLVQTTTSYHAGDIFEIRYDGKFVSYYLNSVLWRTVPDPNKVFFMDSSFYTAGAAVQNVYFGALNPANSSPFIARVNCKVSDENAMKVGGVLGWDSDVYSLEGYPTCHVTWKANQTNADLMIGLSRTPGLNSSYTFDFAMQCASNGFLYIYLLGVVVPGVTIAYLVTDRMAVTYDGTYVRFWKNDTLLYTVGIPGAANVPLFMDSSFYTPNCGVNTLQYGPTTTLQLADTTQINTNAASGFLSIDNFTSSIISLNGGNPATSGWVDIITAVFTSTGNPVSIDSMSDFRAYMYDTNSGPPHGLFSLTAQIYRYTIPPGGGDNPAAAVPVGSIFDLYNLLLQSPESGVTNFYSFQQLMTLNANDTPAAGLHVYRVRISYSMNLAGGLPPAQGNAKGGFNANSPMIKVREYKR